MISKEKSLDYEAIKSVMKKANSERRTSWNFAPLRQCGWPTSCF